VQGDIETGGDLVSRTGLTSLQSKAVQASPHVSERASRLGRVDAQKGERSHGGSQLRPIFSPGLWKIAPDLAPSERALVIFYSDQKRRPAVDPAEDSLERPR
jgi:hypothetical protein